VSGQLPRASLTPREQELVRAAPVARLATVRPGGRPHIVPVTFALAAPDLLVTAVDHKPKRSMSLQRLHNIEANPAVSVLIDHYEPDWDRLWWVRLDGDARVVTAEPERTALVEPLRRKYEQYAARPPEGPVIVVSLVRVVSWRVPGDGDG
jgi:PPOX class probable F420-dependent enzyme